MAGPPLEPAGLPASAVPNSGQLLVVVPVRPGSSRAFLYAVERNNKGGWAAFAGPLTAMVGRNGFARPGRKREGDGRTPAGLYPLEFAFGYAPEINTGMPYRQATSDDLWVDNDKSPDYNQWVRRGRSSAKSFEEMRLPDHRYRHGLVIGYNRNPVIAGLGSAIFIHVWREQGGTTTGCIALDETDLVALLAWLDPAKKPAILMGDPRDLAGLPGLAGFAVAYHPLEPAAHERMVLNKVEGTGNRLVEYSTPDGFAGIATVIPPRVEAEMRRTGSWPKGRAVPITDLGYLVFTYPGLNGRIQLGELVVHKEFALPVIKSFADHFGNNAPLEPMELIDAIIGDSGTPPIYFRHGDVGQ